MYSLPYSLHGTHKTIHRKRVEKLEASRNE